MSHNRGIIVTIVNSFAIILLPLCIVVSILYILLTTPVFYTTILKHTDIVGTFVKAKNFEITQSIQQEIDNKVGLASYVLTYQAAKKQYEEAKKSYDIINKTEEYEKLQKQLEEIENLSYEDVKQAFPDKQSFENNKKSEIEKIQGQIESIEEYRKTYKVDIAAAKEKLDEIEDTFEEAQDEYNEKQEEANEIIQKHQNTFASKLNDDLDLLKPVITAIIHEKLIDGNIVPLIQKYSNFFTSYNTIKSEYILELTNTSNPMYPKKVHQILLPDITISLWVNENGVKKHILSDILLEEIKKTPNIKNRTFLIAVFTFADTAIGEFIGSSYLKKAGLWFDNGVIYKHNIVLSGYTADTVITLIKIFSYARYFVYTTIILILLYIVFIIFSSTDSIKKFLWLKRILIYPSAIILCIGATGILFPLIFIHKSDTVSLISAQMLREVAFNISVCTLAPIMVLFLVLLLCGLVCRKLYMSKL
ncbi:MAG: hypothetical protein WBK20_15275 [Spirochaetota bacterium]